MLSAYDRWLTTDPREGKRPWLDPLDDGDLSRDRARDDALTEARDGL